VRFSSLLSNLRSAFHPLFCGFSFLDIFFKRQNIFFLATLIANFIHQVFGQMDPQPANFTFFNGTFQIRCIDFSGIERDAVIFNIEN